MKFERSDRLRIAVLGLGYVGCVTAACFAREGHQVVGVDINKNKLALLRRGESPIIEPGLEELISEAVATGHFLATEDLSHAVRQSEIIFICVGTPSKKNGSIDLSYVENVCIEIGEVLNDISSYKSVVIRSTILPGVAEELLIPAIERVSSKRAGNQFGFCVNPEFLREGTAISDFDDPPYTIIGEFNSRSGDLLADVYSSTTGPIYRVSLGVGEMIKYASNSFHALKVAYANEIGRLCDSFNMDSHDVMDVFVQDTKLNISKTYLRPGFAFGGSCLPKDLRAMLYVGRQNDIRMPVIESVLPSNDIQLKETFDLIREQGKRRIGLIGLSFKQKTDDLRESPALELAEKLLGKGFEISIYDGEIAFGNLHGSNREFILSVIPHIGSLLRPSITKTTVESDVIVVTKQLSEPEYGELNSSLNSNHILIDLVHLDKKKLMNFEGVYDGISW